VHAETDSPPAVITALVTERCQQRTPAAAEGARQIRPAFELVWQVHAVAFASALGTTCIGAALAAHASGLTPAWQRCRQEEERMTTGAKAAAIAAALGAFAGARSPTRRSVVTLRGISPDSPGRAGP
jgi:hypothetical protein